MVWKAFARRAVAEPAGRGTRPAIRGQHLRPAILALIAGFLLAGTPAFSQTQEFTPGEETPEQFPPGPGRDDTFYACSACHNFKLVAAQGMTRRQWQDTIALMVERYNMPPLAEKDQQGVLDYLESAFPPRAPANRGGWQNPFSPR